MDSLTVPCPACGRPVDLTDPRAVVTPTFSAGYAFCPICGKMAHLDRDTAVRAVKARRDPTDLPGGSA